MAHAMSELRILQRRSTAACFRRRRLPPAVNGFTLVELLVVIAIIGGLVALLLPAVQAARESARLTHCKNNLRQVGVALTLHVLTNRGYPVGCIGGRTSVDKHCISWNVQILPFLEDFQLWSSFDFSVASYHPVNKAVRETVVGVFLCPSTDSSDLFSPKDAWQGAAFTDYGGIYGVEGLGRDAAPGASQTLREDSLGVMLYEEAVAARFVTDGLSKTACVAETTLRRIPTMNEWVNGLNVFSQEQSTPVNAVGLANEVGSPHPGGAALTFCDGHVQFVSESIDQPVLNAMLTKAGGDP